MQVVILYKDYGLKARLIAATKGIKPAIMEIVEEEARLSKNRIIKRISGDKTTSRAVAKRSGDLIATIDEEVTSVTDGVKVHVGSIRPGRGSPYSEIHETGEPTIVPHRARALAIPSRLLRLKTQGSRGVLSTKKARTFFPGYRTIIKPIRKTGKRGIFAVNHAEAVLLFTLVSRVKMPQRRYIDQERTLLPQGITSKLTKLLGKALQINE